MNVMIKWAEMCEPAGEDEVNAYNLDITGDMTKEEVVQKVLEIAANIKQNYNECYLSMTKLGFCQVHNNVNNAIQKQKLLYSQSQ